MAEEPTPKEKALVAAHLAGATKKDAAAVAGYGKLHSRRVDEILDRARVRTWVSHALENAGLTPDYLAAGVVALTQATLCVKTSRGTVLKTDAPDNVVRMRAYEFLGRMLGAEIKPADLPPTPPPARQIIIYQVGDGPGVSIAAQTPKGQTRAVKIVEPKK